MTQVEIRKPTLSPTALGNYETCGRRGQFYQDKDIPRVTTLGQVVGQAWHRGLEHYGNMRISHGLEAAEDNTVRAEMSVIVDAYLVEATHADDYLAQPDDDYDTALLSLATMLETLWSDPSYRWAVTGYEFEAVEAEVIAELGSDTHQFHGIIDAVIGAPGYGTVLTDFKSAGRAWAHSKAGDGKGDGNPRKLIQAPLYAEAWLRMTGEQVNWFAYDVMTLKGKFERVWVDVNPDVRAPFIHRWNQVSEQIEMYREAGLDMPTNPSSMLCSEKWCSFWTYCPMGHELEITRGRDNHEQE